MKLQKNEVHKTYIFGFCLAYLLFSVLYHLRLQNNEKYNFNLLSISLPMGSLKNNDPNPKQLYSKKLEE